MAPAKREHNMWRLGYYRGVTWKMWGSICDNRAKDSDVLNGSKSPIWAWTNVVFPENYSILDYARQVKAHIPHGYVWAIVQYEPTNYILTEVTA
jgi:hypothetical protein